MLAEHLIFTAAIVIMVGVYFTRVTGKVYLWWLIILASVVPDADHINNVLWDIGILQYPVHFIPWIKIGVFHNLLWLIIFACIIAVILELEKEVNLIPAFLFFAFGYALHLIEDYLVYPPVYKFLYPLSETKYGWNILPETMNLGWAGTEVLNVGIVVMAIAVCIYILEKGQMKQIVNEEESE